MQWKILYNGSTEKFISWCKIWSFVDFLEAVSHRCSAKYVVLKILQNSQEPPVLESLFTKVAGLTFLQSSSWLLFLIIQKQSPWDVL